MKLTMQKRIALFLMLLSPLSAGHGMQQENDSQEQVLPSEIIVYLGDFLGHQEKNNISQCNKSIYVFSRCRNPRLDYSNNMIRYVASDEKLKEIVHENPRLFSLNLRGFRVIGDSGLEHLKSLGNITSLNLGGCYMISDLGLKQLQDLSSLNSLNLEKLSLLSDCWLKPISTLTNLTSLNLSDCGVSNRALPCLKSLTNLTSLNLRGIKDAGLIRVRGFTYPKMVLLKHLTNLTSLNLADLGDIKDWWPEHVMFLTNLTSLNLENSGILKREGETLSQSLGLLTNLTSLNLRNVSYDKHENHLINNTEFLKTFINLASLELSRSNLSDELEEKLSPLTNLTSLKLELSLNSISNDFDELKYLKFLTCPTSLKLDKYGPRKTKTIDHLSFLTNLTSLEIGNGIGFLFELTKEDLEHIGALTNLTYLNLKNCSRISNEEVGHLRALTNLSSLNLRLSSEKMNETVENLRILPNISSLSLSIYENVVDKNLERLTLLSNLTFLDLYTHTGTDEGIKHLTAFHNLTSLRVSNSGITNVGLENMKLLTNLTSLSLEKLEKITDEGVMHLSGLINLTELNYNKTLETNSRRMIHKDLHFMYHLLPHVCVNGYQRYNLEDKKILEQREMDYEQNGDKINEDARGNAKLFDEYKK